MIKPVVETIKEGTCLFIYCHDNQYLEHSGLANSKGDSWITPAVVNRVEIFITDRHPLSQKKNS